MASDPTGLLQALLQPGGITGASFNQGQQNALQQQLAPLQVQGAQQSLQLGQQQIAAGNAAAQQAQAYQSWKNAYAANPTAKMLGMGIASFPDQAKAIKDSYDALNQDAQQSRTLQFNQLYNAAKNGSPDLVAKNLTSIIAAEKAAGLDTSDLEDVQQRVGSNDPAALRDVLATAQAHLAITNPDFAKAIGVTDHTNHYTQLGSGGVLDERTGQIVKAPEDKPDKPDWIYDSTNQRWLLKPGTGGGDPTSGGGAAGVGSDTSRLVNSDAGGGQVPNSVQTLGQFVGWGKSLNAKGAKSSSAGTYQINGTTMADFAPRALGANWKSAPFNADTQDKVGEAIFDWAKTQPNPALALSRRWVSLTPAKAAQLVAGSWNQAKGVIAQGETGGGAGASATASQNRGDGQPGVISVPASGLSGAAANVRAGDITSVPASMRAAVQAVAEGRTAAPRPGTRNGEAMLDLVTAYDPTFDAANAKSRLKTRVDFTSGRSAQAVNSLNTAMGHLIHLDDQSQDLGNVGFLGGVINPIRRSIQNNVVGSSKYTSFDQTKQAAASEMRKVFTGSSGGSLAELEGWEKSLNSANSPEQLHDAIKNGVDLMASRLSALQDQYAQGMNRSDKTPQFIRPSLAKQAQQRFGVSLSAPPAATVGNAAQPTHISASGKFAFYPGKGWVAR